MALTNSSNMLDDRDRRLNDVVMPAAAVRVIAPTGDLVLSAAGDLSVNDIPMDISIGNVTLSGAAPSPTPTVVTDTEPGTSELENNGPLLVAPVDPVKSPLDREESIEVRSGSDVDVEFETLTNIDQRFQFSSATFLDSNSARDQIFGSSDRDVIFARGGDDRVSADGGGDVIYGGRGSDTLFGQDGDDRIFGRSQSDVLSGGSGNDILFGGLGDDTNEGFEAGNRGVGLGGSVVMGICMAGFVEG